MDETVESCIQDYIILGNFVPAKYATEGLLYVSLPGP